MEEEKGQHAKAKQIHEKFCSVADFYFLSLRHVKFATGRAVKYSVGPKCQAKIGIYYPKNNPKPTNH